MGKKNIIQEQTITQNVDVETGEVTQMIEQVNRTVKIPNSTEPNYIKLYLNDVINFAGVDILNVKNTRVDVLYCILTYIDYHNEITLPNNRREEISEKCGITVDGFNKVLKYLVENQLLFQKIDKKTGKPIRSIYMANPHYFGRGKWEDVYNLRTTIIYNPSTKRYIQTEINPDPQRALAL